MRNKKNRNRYKKRTIPILFTFFTFLIVFWSSVNISAQDTESDSSVQPVIVDDFSTIGEIIKEHDKETFFEEAVVSPGKSTVIVDGEKAAFKETFDANSTEQNQALKNEDSVQDFFENKSDENTVYETKKNKDGTISVTTPYQTNRIILMIPEGSLHNSFGAKSVYYYTDGKYYVLTYENDQDTEKAYKELRKIYENNALIDYYINFSNQQKGSVDPTQYTDTNEFFWGYEHMGFDTLNKTAKDYDLEKEVVVAVLDTGIQANNPILKNRIDNRCYNVLNGNEDVTDIDSHGTNVAGVIAISTPDNVKIQAIKICDKGISSNSVFFEAYRYAINHGASVVNLSSGGQVAEDWIDQYDQYYDEATRKGIPIVCASGNYSNEAVNFPACNSKTIAVGAVCYDYSSHEYFLPQTAIGKELDFCAPEDVFTTSFKNDSVLCYAAGTSISAPFISSAYAYLKLVNKEFPCDEMYQILKGYCKDFGAEGKDDEYGWGMPIMPTLFKDYKGKNYISKADVTLSQNDFDYTGEAITPAVTVSYKGQILKEGTDYRLSYSDNINANQAVSEISIAGQHTGNPDIAPYIHYLVPTVTITGMGSYEGTATRHFNINPIDISKEPLVLKNTSYEYTGEKIDAEISSLGKIPLSDDNYNISCSDNVNAGTAMIKVTGKGNYTGEVTATYTITPRDIRQNTGVLVQTAFTYDGTAKQPTFIVRKLKEGQDFTVTYENNINPGTARAIATGFGNYSGSIIREFSITPLTLTGNDITLPSLSDMDYTGKALTPDINIEGYKNGTDFHVNYKNNTNAGTAQAVVIFDSPYSGTFEIPFRILPLDITTHSFALSKDSLVYTGKEIAPDVIADNLAQTAYNVTYSNNINAGTAQVIIKGTGNYTGEVKKEFTILPKEITSDLLSVDKESYPYTGKEIKPHVSVDGVPAEDLKLTYSDNIAVGTGNIHVEASDNYSGSGDITFRIVPGNIADIDITLDSDDYPYTGQDIFPKILADGLNADEDYTITYADNINPGKGSVILSGIGNYTGRKTLHFNIIDPSMISKTDIAGFENVLSIYNKSFVYDENEHCPTVEIKGLRKNEDYIITCSNNVNVGTATLTITGMGNYTGTIQRTFEIVPLNISDKEFGYTITLPASVFQYTGFSIKPKVSVNDLEEKDYTVSYKNNKNVGTATVYVTGKGNYKGTINKTFTIQCKHIWDNGTVTKNATSTATGIKKYTCTKCNSHYEETIPKIKATASSTEKQNPAVTTQKPANPTVTNKPNTATTKKEMIPLSGKEKEIKKIRNSKNVGSSSYLPLKLQGQGASSTSITLKWSKVKKANRYIIYGNINDGQHTYKKLGQTRKSTFTHKKLKKNKYYKYIVLACNGNNVIATSPSIHIATKGKKYGNCEWIGLKKKSVKLTVGKSYKIKATQGSANKISIKKYKGFSFESSVPSIATVSSSGKIKAKKKGTCIIYVYAQNGIHKKITIRVK